jgi:DNA polymerase/3'-5' exonuclease PolX
VSSTTIRRPWAQALAQAEAFREMFPPSCYDAWVFAGSLRRRCTDVGDIEHVVMPRWGDVEIGGGLFAERKTVNLLWHRADELLRERFISHHIYKTANNGLTTKWGDKYRGAEFRDCCHEIWTANRDNWGSVLAIRTGPTEYSKMLVNALQRRGFVNAEGYVWNKSSWSCQCGWVGADPKWVAIVTARAAWDGAKHFRAPGTPEESAACCPQCQDPMGLTMERISVPDEASYFKLCGLPHIPPERRQLQTAATLEQINSRARS